MTPSPKRRTALVTGAAGGIGMAVSARLAAARIAILMCDVSPSVTAAAAELAAKGYEAVPIRGDISDEAWLLDGLTQAIADFGGIDILVNNAAISPKHEGKKKGALEMDPAEWRRVLEVNLTGPFLLCRACIPGMVERGWGRVVNLSSQAGRVRADFAGSHYAASKAGLVGFSRVLAGEVGGTGVTVNCVAPGRIQTPMGTVGGQAAMDAYIKSTPAGRMGQPGDVAAAVAFLASDEAGFITGTTVDVNGGFTMN